MGDLLGDYKGIGLGLFVALFAVFVILKVLGIINWKNLWISAPIWAPVAFVCSIFAAALVFIAIKKRFGNG